MKNPFYLLSEAVLLVGGSDGSYLKSSEVLLPSGGSRQCNVPDLPAPAGGGSVITKSTEIHFCGGINPPNGEGNDCYQLISGVWTLQSQKLAASTDDRMQVDMPGGSYIFNKPFGSSQTTSEFLPSDSNSWVPGPTVPGRQMRDGCVVKISDEDFLIIGGDEGPDFSTRIVKFNTRSGTWEDNWGSLLQKRWGLGCTYASGKVIVAGGSDGAMMLESTEIIDVDGRQSRSAGNMSEKRYGLALVTVNNKVLAIGGFNGDEFLSSVEEFNLEEETWSMASYSMEKGPRYIPGYLVVPEDEICG